MGTTELICLVCLPDPTGLPCICYPLSWTDEWIHIGELSKLGWRAERARRPRDPVCCIFSSWLLSVSLCKILASCISADCLPFKVLRHFIRFYFRFCLCSFATVMRGVSINTNYTYACIPDHRHITWHFFLLLLHTLVPCVQFTV